MTKTYKLSGLDCGNCANKIERNILKINGVISSNVNFMAEKMILDIEENVAQTILSDIKNIVKKVDSSVKVIEL